MKFAILTLALLFFTLPAYAANPLAVPDDLRGADFITAVDVEAEVPHGELFIDRAVIAIFPRLENRLTGLVVGNIRLRFAEPGSPQQGAERRRIEFRVEKAFLSCSLSSDIKVLPLGRALAARRWEALSKAEQQEFAEIYAQAFPGSWFVEGPAAGETNPAATPRDPKSGEFYTAFWGRSPKQILDGLALLDRGSEPRDQYEVVRFDFRVTEAGEITLHDRKSDHVLLRIPAP